MTAPATISVPLDNIGGLDQVAMSNLARKTRVALGLTIAQVARSCNQISVSHLNKMELQPGIWSLRTANEVVNALNYLAIQQTTITRRDTFACHALQGIAANLAFAKLSPPEIASLACQLADATIEKLNSN